MELITALVVAIILLLIRPVTELFVAIWKFLVNVCDCCPVDLKEKYGDWADNTFAVVTGATDGVGKEYAKELAKRNINLVLVSRSSEKLIATKQQINEINPDIEIKIIQTDFSERDNDLQTVEAQLANVPVGILVNNVGRLSDYPMYYGEMPRKDIWDIATVNVRATALMTHMVLEKMKERKKGAIVFVASISSLGPLPLMSIYSSSKAFIKHLAGCIQIEYSKYGITVQCLIPFFISTKMIDYSPKMQSFSIACPDAATYARSAVTTLGKLDVTTGYWFHEIFAFFLLICPLWLRSRVGFFINKVMRYESLRNQKNVC